MISVRVLNSTRRAVLLAGCALAVLGSGGKTFAQEADSNAFGVVDIVVTAQKREQSLQDVPVAVTAISTESLQANRILSLMDLGAQAPNLNVRATAGGIGVPTFTMRGSVTYGSVSGQDKTIGVYLDGVYMGSAYGSAFDLPDLERIEVLRCPQGTLFGRNSTAGAISIVTREPSGEFGLRQQLTYGNFQQLRSSTRVELPQVGPLSGSISYTHNERNGDVRNVAQRVSFNISAAAPESWIHKINPRTVARFNDKNSESVFATVKFEPSDSFKLIYRFDWNELRYTPEASQLVAFSPTVLDLISPGFGSTIAGLLALAPPVPAGQHRPDTAKNVLALPGLIKNYGHNVTATLDISDSVSIKNVFGYRKSGSVVAASYGGYDTVVPAGFGPLSGAVFVMGSSISESHVKQWSNELQVNYVSDLLTLTVGGIYFDIETLNGAPRGLPGSGGFFTNFIFGGVIPGGQRNESFFQGTSYAGFAQAEVHVTPQLDVVGGYRLTKDKKDGISYVWKSATAQQLTFNSRYRDSRSSYMLGANFKVTPDVLLYAKYSTGFVSGGSVSGYGYDPETVKAWEAGVKAEIFDRRLRANLALFKADYKHIQAVGTGRNLRPIPDNDVGTLIVDEGNLDTKGFEVELTAAPVRGLTLNAAVGYTDAKFSKINPNFRITNETTVRPKWTSNLSAQFDTQPLFGDAFLMFRADAAYRSRSLQLQGVINPPAGAVVKYSDAMWLLNGRFALRDINIGGANAELALWGRNLTNADNPGQPIDLQVGIISSSYVEARSYGVDLTFEF